MAHPRQRIGAAAASSRGAALAPAVPETIPSAVASDGPNNATYPKSARLRRRREFLAVQRQGRRVYTPHFILVVRPAPKQRLGVTVTKKVANAVGRNRVKRLVREVFRRNRGLFPQAETVVIAKAGAPELDYARIVEELTQAQPALTALGQSRRPSRRGSR